MSTTHVDKTSPALAALAADLRRYRQDPWIKGRLWWVWERTVWPIVVYRLGQRVLEMPNAWLRGKLMVLVSIVASVVESVTTVKIPPTATIGPGMRIYHGVGLALNGGVVIGREVVLRHGVTLGSLEVGGLEFPRVGDGVDFGAYAQVYGGVSIGDGAKIGAMSVVLKDVATGATVFGNPARVVKAGP